MFKNIKHSTSSYNADANVLKERIYLLMIQWHRDRIQSYYVYIDFIFKKDKKKNQKKLNTSYLMHQLKKNDSHAMFEINLVTDMTHPKITGICGRFVKSKGGDALSRRGSRMAIPSRQPRSRASRSLTLFSITTQTQSR